MSLAGLPVKTTDMTVDCVQ